MSITKTLAIAVALVNCLLSTFNALADEAHLHAHQASPKHYQVMLENSEVLVLKMTLLPGQADTLHHHHMETVYFQQGGQLRISVPGQPPLEVEVPDGHVMWHDAWTHQVTNIGDSAVVAIIVESRHSPSNQNQGAE